MISQKSSSWLLMVFSLTVSLVLVRAQQAVTSTEVLRTALQDESFLLQNGNDAFFSQSPLGLPLLEELEFRTETHEFDPQLQEYALRFKFNSRRQIRVQQSINQQEQALRYYAQQEYLEALLFHRYQLLVDVWYHQQQLAFLDAQHPWYRDQEQLIRQRIASRGQRSYDDLLKLEDDELAFQQRIGNSTQRLTQLKALCNTWLPATPDTLLFPAWPQTTDIANYWQNWQFDTLTLPWSVQQQAATKALATLDWAAERAEERNRLNFFQLRYQGETNPIFREQLTLGVGVTLPFRSARSVKNQYLLLEEREEAWQEVEKRRNWLEKLRVAEIKLATQLEKCTQAQAAYDDYFAQFSPRQLAQQGVNEPELLLRAQGGLFHRQQLLLEQQHQLYRDYLEVLLLSGRLSEAPYRNWLSVTGDLLAQ